jgi:hypothetical protein
VGLFRLLFSDNVDFLGMAKLREKSIPANVIAKKQCT